MHVMNLKDQAIQETLFSNAMGSSVCTDKERKQKICLHKCSASRDWSLQYAKVYLK